MWDPEINLNSPGKSDKFKIHNWGPNRSNLIEILDLNGSNADLPLLYGTHMGSLWVWRGTTVPLFKHTVKKSKFTDINANNNNNNNNKTKIIVCLLQNENYLLNLS